MEHTSKPATEAPAVKKGYNEKNPGQPQGAFPPDGKHQDSKEEIKSNAADKKEKEDSN